MDTLLVRLFYVMGDKGVYGRRMQCFCFEFAATVSAARGRVRRSRCQAREVVPVAASFPGARRRPSFDGPAERSWGAERPGSPVARNRRSARRLCLTRRDGEAKGVLLPLSSGHELLKQNGHLRSVASGSSSFFVVSDAPMSVPSPENRLGSSFRNRRRG